MHEYIQCLKSYPAFKNNVKQLTHGNSQTIFRRQSRKIASNNDFHNTSIHSVTNEIYILHRLNV